MSDVQSDFVWDNIYKGALKGGAKDRFAKDAAVQGLEDYKKGKYKKIGVGPFIISAVAAAVKRSKKA